jgi:hypothetical protein
MSACEIGEPLGTSCQEARDALSFPCLGHRDHHDASSWDLLGSLLDLSGAKRRCCLLGGPGLDYLKRLISLPTARGRRHVQLLGGAGFAEACVNVSPGVPSSIDGDSSHPCHCVLYTNTAVYKIYEQMKRKKKTNKSFFVLDEKVLRVLAVGDRAKNYFCSWG